MLFFVRAPRVVLVFVTVLVELFFVRGVNIDSPCVGDTLPIFSG